MGYKKHDTIQTSNISLKVEKKIYLLCKCWKTIHRIFIKEFGEKLIIQLQSHTQLDVIASGKP
jgi:hypothetical protein